MAKYLIDANSFAAPFFSDQSTKIVEADTPTAALEVFVASYSHPCGLYAAACYASAEAYHEGAKPLARWLCNHAAELKKAQDEAMADGGVCSTLSEGPGRFRVGEKWFNVENPKGGVVVAA